MLWSAMVVSEMTKTLFIWIRLLRLRLEIQHDSCAHRDEYHPNIDQRIGSRFWRVLPHRVQHVYDRGASENQRHYVGRNASTLESVDDAKCSSRSKRASERRPGNASAV